MRAWLTVALLLTLQLPTDTLMWFRSCCWQSQRSRPQQQHQQYKSAVLRLKRPRAPRLTAAHGPWATSSALRSTCGTARCGILSGAAVNGSFAAPNGAAFSSIAAPFLSPALSGFGLYRVNFGERPFEHAPPDAEHVSVHAFHPQQQ